MEMGQMSSHREAPEISKDPVADNADVYAFVSPDEPKTVTLITNFVPLQDPPGGPNFFEFGDDVLYSIYIDNDGDGGPRSRTCSGSRRRSATPRRSSTTRARSCRWTARTGTGASSTRSRASMAVTQPPTAPGRRSRLKVTSLGRDLPCPPCNIGPRSTPNYSASLGQPAVHALPAARRCSPGSGGKGSSSTSGRSSTSATCGRSSTCT